MVKDRYIVKHAYIYQIVEGMNVIYDDEIEMYCLDNTRA